jgi:hypothetical protein
MHPGICPIPRSLETSLPVLSKAIRDMTTATSMRTATACLCMLLVAGCGGGSAPTGPAANGGEPAAGSGSTSAIGSATPSPEPYFRSEKLTLTFDTWSANTVFITNQSEFVDAYGSTWLLLIGGETASPAPPRFSTSDFKDSVARVFRIGPDGVTTGDPRLDAAATVSNQPQDIVAADLNGDGIKDWVIGAYGPDSPETPGGVPVVLESGSNGWTRQVLPATPFPTESIATGRIGTRPFVYVSSQLCLDRYKPYLLIRDADGTWKKDTSGLPSFLLQTPGKVCDQQGYIGVAAVDLDRDGHDDLVLGIADDAWRSTFPNYRGGIVLFGDGNGFNSGRTVALPPTPFNASGVRNTTVQKIRAERLWGDETYLIVSYSQANALGTPAVGGGIQLLRYDRVQGVMRDVTASSFSGNKTFDDTGVGLYSWGGPFNLWFLDVNDDGCVDLVTSRRAGLWINDCSGQFVWGGHFVQEFVRDDRLMPYRAGSEVGFLAPDPGERGGERGYSHIRRARLLPTPKNGTF